MLLVPIYEYRYDAPPTTGFTLPVDPVAPDGEPPWELGSDCMIRTGLGAIVV